MNQANLALLASSTLAANSNGIRTKSIVIEVSRKALLPPNDSPHFAKYPRDDRSSPILEGPFEPGDSATDDEDDDYDSQDSDDGDIAPEDSASRPNSPAPPLAGTEPAKSDRSHASSHRSIPPAVPEPTFERAPSDPREEPRTHQRQHKQPRQDRASESEVREYREQYTRRRPDPRYADTVDEEYYPPGYGHQGYGQADWRDVPHGPGGHYPPSVVSDPRAAYYDPRSLHRHAPPRGHYPADAFAYHAQQYYAAPGAPQGYFPGAAAAAPPPPPPLAIMPAGYGQVPQYPPYGYPPYMQPPISPPATEKSDESARVLEAQLKIMTKQMEAMELARVEKDKAREKAEAEKVAAIEAKAAEDARVKQIAQGQAAAATAAKEAAEKAAAETLKKATEAHDKAIKEAKEAQEKAEKAAKAAKEEADKFKPDDDAGKLPIKFKDAVGRKFSFPYGVCKKWAGMEKLIRQAFMHVDVIGMHVQEGHFDLLGPNGEIILPEVWETTVQPDWSITMHMWPMPEDEKKKKKAEAAAAGPPPVPTGAAPRDSGRSGLFGRRSSRRTPRPSSMHGAGVPPAPPPPPPGLVLEDPEIVGPAPAADVVVMTERRRRKSKQPPTGVLWLAGGGVRRRTDK